MDTSKTCVTLIKWMLDVAINWGTKASQQRDTARLSDPPALESLDITGITLTEPITAPTAEQLLLSTHISCVLSERLNQLHIPAHSIYPSVRPFDVSENSK
jgi:hypothetical protein